VSSRSHRGDVMSVGVRRVLASCAAVWLAGLLVSATSAHASEKMTNGDAWAASAGAAFECPGNSLCLYDSSDGVGEPLVVVIKWAGGKDLPPEWVDRASAYRNTLSPEFPANTHYLYDRSSGSSCYTYRATLPPDSQGSLPPAADNNADMVANMSFGDEWCPTG
jgi:hypothetical protein